MRELRPQLQLQEQQQEEKGLREDLIKFYKHCHSTIPVAPLVEENDVPLTDFYVQPPLTSIDVRRKFGSCQEKSSIQSYHNLFLHGDGTKYRNIYVTAKAGFGKTSFAKKICMTWCQAHMPVEIEQGKFNQEDVDVMKKFEFLFMVSLRDIDLSVCEIEDILEKGLIRSLAKPSRYPRPVLERLLSDSECLIVLDGLDEWSHPRSCKIGQNDINSTPCRLHSGERCTVLITTRPWKFTSLKLGIKHIDAHVEISELDEESSKQLVSNAVVILNRQNVQSVGELESAPKTVREFETATSTMKLDNVRYIPYILLQIICLWFDEKSIGRSKCEIYSNIIALTLSRGLSKLENETQPLREENPCLDEIPLYLQSDENCKIHYDVFKKLGLLAFKKLFGLVGKNNLIFDESELHHIISPDMLTFCLKVGLLTQNKVACKVSERHSTISFHHKSVQEYMAALHIHSCLESPETQNLLWRVCNTLPAVLEMSNVLIFLAGFRPAGCSEIFQKLEDNLEKDAEIKIFRENPITGQSFQQEYQTSWETMKSFQNLKIGIMQEIFSHGEKAVPFPVEDIIIDSTVSEEECGILKLLSENNKEKVKSLSITECKASEFTEKLKTLDMQTLRSLQKLMIDAVAEDQDLQSLLFGSANTLTCLYLAFSVFDKKIKYDERNIKTISSETVRIITKIKKLQKLSLEWIGLKHDDIGVLFDYLTKRETMTDVGLSNIICIDDEICKGFELHQRKTMTDVGLSNIICIDDKTCEGFQLDLSKNKNLKELELDKAPVATINLDLSSLEVCVIGQLSENVLSSFLCCLPEAKNLRTVSFDSFEHPQMIEILAKLVQIETLSIQQHSFKGTFFSQPLQMLSLKNVHLYEVYMNCKSFRNLLERLTFLPQEITVKLEACNVLPLEDDMQEFAEYTQELEENMHVSKIDKTQVSDEVHTHASENYNIQSYEKDKLQTSKEEKSQTSEKDHTNVHEVNYTRQPRASGGKRTQKGNK